MRCIKSLTLAALAPALQHETPVSASLLDLLGDAALGASAGTEVQVVVYWQNPTDPNLHQFTITAYIN